MVKESKPKKSKKPAKRFVPPTIEEVKTMMAGKKPKWPASFIAYYAEKFHSYYTSNGWKVGGRAAMKNFSAAFCSQWQQLKYKEDQDMLYALTPKVKPIDHDTLEYLNEALDVYRKDSTLVSEERLAACYDWMKENNLLRLTASQREDAISASKIDLKKGKSTAVKFAFDRMVKNLLDFNYYFNEVTNH